MSDLQLLSSPVAEVETRSMTNPLAQVSSDSSLSAPQHHALSPAQQRLWFLDQLGAEGAYNTFQCWRLSGPLDPLVLEQSLNEIVRRHDTLRTTFPSVENIPQQKITPTLTVPWVQVDLRILSPDAQQRAIERYARHEAVQAFDLARGPLIRSRLLVCDRTDHVLMLTLHHIICDGWSLGVLYAELATIYEAFCRGAASPLSELNVQYVDYLARVRERINTPAVAADLAYWKNKLAALPVVQLPVDSSRPAHQTFRGGQCVRSVSPEVFTALQALGKRERATLYMTLVAAFHLLLSRYSGQQDIVSGSPMANRAHRDTEALIGHLINMVVLRVDLGGRPTFRQLLAQVRTVAIEAFQHQAVPFEKLVEALQPERDASRNPFFQHLFALQSVGRGVLKLPRIEAEFLDMGPLTTHFDIELHVWNINDGLRCELRYNTDLFQQATAERMLDHYVRLLQLIVNEPDRPVDELSLLTPAERHQLLVAWNATARDYPQNKCIHELFEEQVERTPDAVAVVFEDQQLSYSQLNTSANQLAHYLQRVGVGGTLGAETFVGICVERSIEMVVGLLAILKAGGAYVPLDPTYPQERLAFLIEDAQVPILLTQRHLCAQLPSHPGRTLCLDSDWALFTAMPTHNPAAGVRAENLAYMIYTSGSTGKPKGAMNTQLGICNRLRWMQSEYHLTVEDRVVQKTPISFDVSVWEIFWPLLVGARLVVAKPEGHKDPHYLADLFRRQAITTAHFVPSMLQNFLAIPEVESCHTLRRVICSGEALPLELQRRFFARSKAELHNLYGPTEAAIEVTHWACQPDIPLSVVPIGRPIANTQIYILDNDLQPVPIGLAGELHIGGVQVARGYHNRADLTQEKFIPNPYGVGRLYKTGDLARFLPDGNIEYLGRMDNQVKLRGFRVELGEIEVRLNDHPSVAQSVVTLREERPGDKRLVAYCLPAANANLNFAELARHLQRQLPDYMIPAAFVALAALPLTPNGKLDRRALPVPDYRGLEIETHYTAPRTPQEEQVASIWCEVLGLKQVGVHDNFFKLGGHSLLATQLVARLRRIFQVELPLSQIFETPTVAGLATVVKPSMLASLVAPEAGAIVGEAPLTLAQQQRGDVLMPIAVQPADAPFVMSYEQQAFWLRGQLDRARPREGGRAPVAVHHMQRAFWLRGSLNRPALQQAMRQLLERQAGLRLYFPQIGQESEVACHPVYDPLQFLDFGDLPAAEQKIRLHQTAYEQATTPFDLAHERLLRLQLIRLNEETHVLLLTLHHILGDAWSLAIWEDEWRALYVAACRQQSASLPSLPVHYKDYAAWQRRYLSGERFRKQQAYWINQLRDAPRLLKLPTDYPRPTQQQGQGNRYTLALTPELHHALQQVAQQHNCTLFMVLFSAFNLLLYRFSGQTDLCIGVPIENRRHPETQNLIGIFLNILAMRTRVDGQESFAHLLHQVRCQTLEAHTHADFPFAHLMSVLKPTPQQAYNPYFQVMFNWVTIPRSQTPVEESAMGTGSALQIEPFLDILHDGEQAISNLDLVVTLTPAADGGIRTQWLYDTALFKAQTVDLLTQSYQRILAQVVEHAQTALKDFSLADAQTPLYPLTLAQRDIWVDQILYDETPLYNIGGYVQLFGPLDVERFRQAVNLLIQKHDNLRLQLTKSRDENGIPQQTLVPPFRVQVPLHDLRGTDAQAAALQWMQQHFAQPFPLEGEPLFRYALIRVADEAYYWFFQYHHLIADGWGISLLNRSLAELYTALSQGHAPDLQSPSYLDYIADDQSYLQSERYTNQRDYWLKQYTSVPEPLLKPRASNKGPVASDCYAIHLPQTLYQQLDLLAKQYQASTFHVLIGAVALYFARTQGRDEVVIGLPILNRSSAAFKKTAGLFTSVSPTRLSIDASASFGELLRNISQTLRANYRHQRLPIGEINRAVKPAAPHRQLYDIGLSYESHDYDAYFDTVVTHTEPLLHGWEQTPLMLYVRDFHAEGDVRWDFVANRAYFSAPEIERLQQHLVHLLNTLLTQADRAIGQISLLTEAEQQQMLVEWNQTATDYPGEQSIHELFEEQAARTPDAIAVVDGERQLTYRLLNTQANQLARHLQQLGVAPGMLVGLYLERSIEFIVSMLAILKTGAAYMPLDLSYPQERLAFLFADAALPFLITQTQLGANLPPCMTTLITLDKVWLALDQQECANVTLPTGQSSADRAAYVMYTSGSTGQPKGIVIPQRAVARLVFNTNYITLSAADCLAHLSNVAFDAATFEVWGALLHGAKLVILVKTVALSPTALAAQIEQHGITTMFVTTALFNQLVREKPDIFAAVKQVLFGGEAVNPHWVRAVINSQPPQRLLHVYGPTESTTFAAWHLIEAVPEDATTIPIGKPLANTQLYVLDRHLQPVPIDVPGELYIGGDGLALGYLNRPELTAERFIPHPFGAPGTRLYRTGDFARYRADGVIEFLGRVDRQVKLRGFRVEPGEIEAVLRKHPAVRDGVVDVVEDERLGKRLVAWWIGKAGTETDAGALRDFLRQSLPDYMLPTAFTQVEAFPLNANGKVDLRQLPAPSLFSAQSGGDGKGEIAGAHPFPQTLLERQLLSIWQQVLGTKNLGVEDDFFDVGGHSLLAIRLLTSVSAAVGQELPVSSLFYGPTIRQQAALVAQKGWSPPWTALVPVQPTGTRPPLFLLPPAAATGIRLRKFARHLGANQPLYSFDPIGLDGRTQPPDRIEDIAAHYLDELLRLMPEGPYLLGGLCFGAHVAYEMARQLYERNLAVPTLVVFDAGQPANGPSWRFVERTPVYFLGRLKEFWQQGELFPRLKRLLPAYSKLLRMPRRQSHFESQEMKLIRDASLKAQLSYTAQAFPIRIVLFQSEEYAHLPYEDGWYELGLEGVEVIQFPNTTHRSLLLEDENMARIADKLCKVIDHWIADYWPARDV